MESTVPILTGFIQWNTEACTICRTEAGRLVREGVFNSDFGITFLSVIIPFPILLIAVGIIIWLPNFLEPKRK
jgi:hypothetical protein